MLKFTNISITLAIIIASWFLFVGYNTDKDISEKEKGHMAKILPSSPAGWSSKDLPLGATEEIARSAEKILSVSEYFNREYTSPDGSKSFVVYISYWGKGKANTNDASSHSPDRCWILNGWKQDESQMKSGIVLSVDDVVLEPAYHRKMNLQTPSSEVSRFVYFWHILDGKALDYGTKSAFNASISFQYIKHAFQTAFVGSPEQYFIRIDSALPFSELENEEAFKDVLKALAKLALEKKSEQSISK